MISQIADDAVRYGHLIVFEESRQDRSLSDDINLCTTGSPIKAENELTELGLSTNHAGHEDEELLAEGILSARHD